MDLLLWKSFITNGEIYLENLKTNGSAVSSHSVAIYNQFMSNEATGHCNDSKEINLCLPRLSECPSSLIIYCKCLGSNVKDVTALLTLVYFSVGKVNIPTTQSTVFL